jgi:DNA invertase Pin-like site-specific DNA recombinase
MNPSEKKVPSRPVGAVMARVSLEKQAKEGYSLPAQTELGKLIAAKHEIDVGYVLEDAGFGGDDWDRPAINRALGLVRAGKVTVLIFTNCDRFSRDVLGGLAIIKELREAGARIIFGDLGEYTNDTNFRMMLTIRMAVAEAEKANIRNRSQVGMMRKIRQGDAFGRAPYGFKIEDRQWLRFPTRLPSFARSSLGSPRVGASARSCANCAIPTCRRRSPTGMPARSPTFAVMSFT